MSDTFNIGLSGLLASQRGLATTGHNIANVNTAGYSRQRVTFETREPQFTGVGYAGKGVDVQSIRRLANEFLVDQLRLSKASEASATKMTELVDQVDRQIGDALVAGGLDAYFNALGDANNDPRLMATRQVLLESASSLVSRFAEQEEQMNGLARSVNQQIRGTVEQINSMTTAIADINQSIARGAGLASGEPANDLLDKREQLLVELSELVGVQVQKRSDGMVNVLVGDGQLVVTGGSSSPLLTAANNFDASRVEVGFDAGGSFSAVSNAISGGSLGALIAFREDTLDPARNAIGRLAVTFATTMNAQHRQGMTLKGALGSDLFSVPGPTVGSPGSNSGTIAVSFDSANIGNLTTSDYELSHNGTAFSLLRLSDGVTQTLSGAGPFNVDGMVITISTAAANGDRHLLQPTKFVPRALALAVRDPADLALASPVRTAAATANISEATISRPSVLNPANAALLTTTQLVFNDPPSTYQVNGAGPLIAYTSGANIDINGWRVQVSGAPVAGDSFSIASNAGGFGDNSNGLLLNQLQFAPILAGGTASYQESYGILVGEVGAKAQQAHISSSALSALAENAQAARDSLSGVNLEEEAANLLRYQQAFQAAARIISAADSAFQALIDATRG